ncbi:MAG: SRPBCC domain-containing protein [Myxococcales bacterium]|nr:SRPBCC domain-containing protein [Myxococcales bacterium]
MTAPTPTGRLVGNDLQLTRTFRAPIDDVWKSVTDSASTSRWFGPWHWVDKAGPGNLIAYTMIQEEGAPESSALVERCEAPRHLALTTQGKYSVSYELTLVESGGTTTMTFVHHLGDRKMAGDFGPGWEFYLDLLVHSRDGLPFRKFDDYYPSQKQYYLDLAAGE